jgi:hypothetical protein
LADAVAHLNEEVDLLSAQKARLAGDSEQYALQVGCTRAPGHENPPSPQSPKETLRANPGPQTHTPFRVPFFVASNDEFYLTP